MPDEFGADDELLAAMAASSRNEASGPRRIQQPTPQRLDKAPPTKPDGQGASTKIVQPVPQALPTRSSGSSILVSPRQRGNPLLSSIRSFPWEYSDILADYVMGLTTCALFLRFVCLLVLPCLSGDLHANSGNVLHELV
jgi:DNA excision repair protein ERCC-1